MRTDQVRRLSFNLPEAGEATITIQDVRGRMVHRIEGQFAAGYNEVELSRMDIQAKGLYFYTLQAGHRVATKKLNILK